MDLYRALTPDPAGATLHGVAIAVVTNNNDPEKLGRVKLKFPWLSDELESNWARIAAPGAGANRGLAAVPMVDDEVLVAFEHGLIDRPYVLGGLWNGKDKPPALPDGKPASVRLFRSTTGHEIRLDDTDGKEKIEITTNGSKSTIVLDTKGTITIRSEGDLVIESKTGAVKISGQKVEISARTDLELKGGTSLKQSGGVAEVKADGQLTLKGAMVRIN